MIHRRGLERKHGRTGQLLKAHLSLGKNKAKGFSNGPMEVPTTESLTTTRLMVTGSTYGVTSANTRVHGRKIKCMVRVFSLGLMENYM